MPAYQLFQLPKQFSLDSSGRTQPGAKAYFYATGTSTPQNTFTDATLVTPNANPVVADAAGVFGAIYLNPALEYDLTLNTSADVLIYSRAKVNDQPVTFTQTTISDLLYPITSAETSAGVTPSTKIYPSGIVERYGNVNVTASWTSAKSQYLASGRKISNLPVSITDFGGKPDDSSFDNTAALNAAVACCVTNGFRQIFFPFCASWYFKTQPAVIPSGIQLIGEHERAFLVRDYTAGSNTEAFLQWDGSTASGTERDKGGGMQRLGILSGSGTTLGAAINIVGASTTSRDGWMTFRDVVISGVGSFFFGVRIDGTNITTAGAQGMRDIAFANLTVFRCSGAHVQVSNGVNVSFRGLAVLDGGLGGTPLVNITGAGAATSNSNDVHVSNLNCGGNLTIQQCVSVSVVGRVIGTLTIDVSATNVSFIGTANAVTNTSTTATVLDTASKSQFSGGVKLINSSIMDFSNAVSASATAGGGGALPALPTAYVNVMVDGIARRMPYYNV